MTEHGKQPGDRFDAMDREGLLAECRRQEKLIKDIRTTCNTLLVEERVARGTADWPQDPVLYGVQADAVHPLKDKRHERYALACELLTGRMEKAEIAGIINLVLAAAGIHTRKDLEKAVARMGGE